MSNGTKREPDFNKVDTLSSSDYVRVIKGGASRNISIGNLATTLSTHLNSISSVITSETNYLASASNNVILMNLTSGPLTMTLPAASSSEGVLLQVKKIDATTNDLMIQAVGGNIDGSTTATLSGSGGAKPGASFISDGLNWYILNA